MWPCPLTIFQSTPSSWRVTEGRLSVSMATLHSNLLPPYGAMGTKGRYNARHVHFNPRSLHGGRPPSCVLPLSGSHGPIPSMKQALSDKALFRKPASPLPQLKNFGNRIRPVAPLRDGKGCCFQSLQPLSCFLGDGGFASCLRRSRFPPLRQNFFQSCASNPAENS